MFLTKDANKSLIIFFVICLARNIMEEMGLFSHMATQEQEKLIQWDS